MLIEDKVYGPWVCKYMVIILKQVWMNIHVYNWLKLSNEAESLDNVQRNHPSWSDPWSKIWAIYTVHMHGCVSKWVICSKWPVNLENHAKIQPSLKISIHEGRPAIPKCFKIPLWIIIFPIRFHDFQVQDPPGWAALTTASLARLNSWKPWSWSIIHKKDCLISFIYRIILDIHT